MMEPCARNSNTASMPTERDAVYGASTCADLRSTENLSESHAVFIKSEHSPSALSKIFAILATFSVVPVHALSTAGENDVLELEISLEGMTRRRANLLYRKILQLTDTIDASLESVE